MRCKERGGRGEVNLMRGGVMSRRGRLYQKRCRYVDE